MMTELCLAHETQLAALLSATLSLVLIVGLDSTTLYITQSRQVCRARAIRHQPPPPPLTPPRPLAPFSPSAHTCLLSPFAHLLPTHTPRKPAPLVNPHPSQAHTPLKPTSRQVELELAPPADASPPPGQPLPLAYRIPRADIDELHGALASARAHHDTTMQDALRTHASQSHHAGRCTPPAPAATVADVRWRVILPTGSAARAGAAPPHRDAHRDAVADDDTQSSDDEGNGHALEFEGVASVVVDEAATPFNRIWCCVEVRRRARIELASPPRGHQGAWPASSCHHGPGLPAAPA